MEIEERTRAAALKGVEDKTLDNLYRQMYGFPKDMDARKPDRLLQIALNSSEVFEKGRSLLEHSLNPSLIYFEEGTHPMQISKVMKTIHVGSDGPEAPRVQAWRKISDSLITGKPKLSHNV